MAKIEEFKLGNEEKILLDTAFDEDYKVKFKNRVVVTNQRCIFYKVYDVSYHSKSINPTTGKYEEIKPEFRMEQEINLNDLKETFAHYHNPNICIKFRLTNGQTTIFPLIPKFGWEADQLLSVISGTLTGPFHVFIQDLMNDMFLVDRLVSYINHLLTS
jgi:hypothetical protein